MKFFVLKKPVIFPGRTMVGFGKAIATFTPPDQIYGFDPLKLSFLGNKTRSIDTNCARVKTRRIEFSVDKKKIDAVEHYTPLRFLFPGTNIEITTGKTLPYVPCTGFLLQAMLRARETVDVKVPWFTVKEICYWEYPERRNGLKAFTLILPNYNRQLVINVRICFKDFGEHHEQFVFPNIDLLKQVLSAQTVGMIPSCLKPFGKILWYHGRNVFWPKRSEPKKALRIIARHRVHDILGAVCLMQSPIRGGFPSLTINSQCSGHLADLEAMRMAQTTPF
jgi:hypothetical protein